MSLNLSDSQSQSKSLFSDPDNFELRCEIQTSAGVLDVWLTLFVHILYTIHFQ